MQTRDLIAKVRKLEIRTKCLSEQVTEGTYRSVFKGHGIEFSEVREYTQEDDVRDIDWNVTARTGNVYIKKYEEERELTVMLVVDVSASTLWGTSGCTKRETMIECAALLAFSAIRNHDKVGLLLFSGKTELYLPPRSGKKHVLRIIREMLAWNPSEKGTNIAAAAQMLSATLKKRSVIFFISDFMQQSDYELPLRLLGKRHDVSALRVTDKTEWEMPALAGLNLQDAETGVFYSENSMKRDAGSYRQISERMYKETESLLRRARIDLADLENGDEDLMKKLIFFFRKHGIGRNYRRI